MSKGILIKAEKGNHTTGINVARLLGPLAALGILVEGRDQVMYKASSSIMEKNAFLRSAWLRRLLFRPLEGAIGGALAATPLSAVGSLLGLSIPFGTLAAIGGGVAALPIIRQFAKRIPYVGRTLADLGAVRFFRPNWFLKGEKALWDRLAALKTEQTWLSRWQPWMRERAEKVIPAMLANEPRAHKWLRRAFWGGMLTPPIANQLLKTTTEKVVGGVQQAVQQGAFVPRELQTVINAIDPVIKPIAGLLGMNPEALTWSQKLLLGAGMASLLGAGIKGSNTAALLGLGLITPVWFSHRNALNQSEQGVLPYARSSTTH